MRKNLAPCSFMESNARAIAADRHSMMGTCTHSEQGHATIHELQNWRITEQARVVVDADELGAADHLLLEEAEI